MSEAPRRQRWPFILGGFVAVVVLGVTLSQWDWLLPAVNRMASAAAGRDVRAEHLHVRLGRPTHIELDQVTIANPAGWTGGDPPFGVIQKVALDVEILAYFRTRALIIPNLTLTQPKLSVVQLSDPKALGGDTNYKFGAPTDPNAKPSPGPQIGPQIGRLTIEGGEVHAKLARLSADFVVNIETLGDTLHARAHGTYAKQPITAEATGGALLSLRDASQPYPIEGWLANGPTKLTLKGTVQDPLSFSGANLHMDLAGPDMALLLPLTGVAIPKTPPYRVAGQFDYSDAKYIFKGIQGKVGSSDLEGDVTVDTRPADEQGGRPLVTATLASRLVDLKDLGGFIGAEPGDASKGTKRATVSDGRVLPNDPISLPRLNAADVHLRFKAARIQGRAQPLDTMRADLDIVNGAVHLHPLAFGIGGGQITSDIELTQANGQAVKARATIDFQRVSVDKLLASTGMARGAGSIGGRAVIDGTGRSLAEIVSRGNGELKLYMGSGGNVSALLVDLSGLQFGNALMSLLGIPQRARIQCFVTDFVLQGGVAQARTAVLDTDENRVVATGSVNLASEQIALVLETDAKHFSVGSLPAPINIRGTLANPSVAPDAAILGARAGAAIGLGILLTPLGALIPTIQLGTGEDGACASLMRQGRTPPKRRG